jgi:hypothetical protein
MSELSIEAVPVPFSTDQIPPGVAFVKAGVLLPTVTVAEPPPIAATAMLFVLTVTGAMSKQPELFVPFI